MSSPIRHIKKPDEKWIKGLSFRQPIGSDVVDVVEIAAIDLATGSSADVAEYKGNDDGVISVLLYGGQLGHKYQITVTVKTKTAGPSPVPKEIYQKDIIMSVVSVI
jgi:hypothetical protein